ncbi:MAG TPA: CopG family transcriptional regulator [Thermoanaerobaculia bacterium]|jgi:metal-responsive CopG/Arc/MetJ family transcriptional regulator|nr:CopG family transcriptional regulator [Thermoanaerobaculia bacterium]
MKTVQMTLDEDLIERVDEATRQLKTTRSAFTREALNAALKRMTTLEHEAQHRRGYEAAPEGRDEFSDWAAEQVWPE